MQSEAVTKVKSGWLGWKVISLLGRHRVALAGLMLLILTSASLDIAVPFLTQTLIDRIIQILKTNRPASVGILLLTGVGIFCATAATRALRSLYNYWLLRTSSRCEDDLKNAAFRNFLTLDTAYHGAVNTGEVVGALDRGSTAVYVVLYEILGQNMVPPLVVVLGVLASLLAKNVWIGLIVALPLPAYLLAVSRLSRRLHSYEGQSSAAFEAVTKESYDIASNARVVKRFAQEEPEAQLQRGLLRLAREKQYKVERLWALVENVQSFIATAGRVGVITFGGYLVLNHRCSIGDYVLFIAMQDMVYGPISQLSIILPKLRRNLSRAERLFEIRDEKRTLKDPRVTKQLQSADHSVEFRNLSFRYGSSERWTLNNVNFRVFAGSTVALIGASGSGKSTLVNLLQRLYDPQHGSILIDGTDLRDVTQESLRAQIAIVPQEVELFSRSIFENIAYGLKGVSYDDVEAAARKAQAHEFIMRCEDGYDSQVGERGLRLSGGERQRIGLARAILRDPKILILDEATSHLDNESERLIQIALAEITKERTCFVIAHRLSTVHNADMVILFAEGGIEAIGTHEELWDSSQTYRILNGQHLADRRAKVTSIRPAEVVRENEEAWLEAVG